MNCSQCFQGFSSPQGSTVCMPEDMAFLFSLTLAITKAEFSPQMQQQFIFSVSSAGGIPTSSVSVVDTVEISTRSLGVLHTIRRLLGSGLVVTTEVKTIGQLFGSAVAGIGNNQNLDSALASVGLSASSAVTFQMLCPAGQFYGAEQIGTACANCTGGTYTSSSGFATSCLECYSGTYSVGTGATTCVTGSSSTLVSGSRGWTFAVGGVICFFMILVVVLWKRGPACSGTKSKKSEIPLAGRMVLEAKLLEVPRQKCDYSGTEIHAALLVLLIWKGMDTINQTIFINIYKGHCSQFYLLLAN